MKKLWIKMSFLFVFLMALSGSFATSDEDRPGMRARLSGFHEVPPISTMGKGEFSAKLSDDKSSISYTLKYSDLSSPPSMAHIHFGQRGVNGGVFAFLCGGGSKPACPAAPATVTGTIVAADILAVAAQGLAAGDFAAALRIIRSGDAYVNVHTTLFSTGEIRGQIRPRKHADDGEEEDDD